MTDQHPNLNSEEKEPSPEQTEPQPLVETDAGTNAPNQNVQKKSRSKWNKSTLIFGFNVSYRVIRATFITLGIFFLLAGALAAGTGAGYFVYLVKESKIPSKEELTKAINNTEQVSRMLYADGTPIANFKSDIIRTNVSSEEISPLIKNAIIATEDEYFNEHKGVVPKAVVRALISDATGFGGGSGGSTLTQQLIKQQVLTSETNYKRKANEILLALRLEKFFNKDQILTSYLNVSPFGRNNKGQNIAGIEAAAQGIFGKSAKDVTLPEAAYLAGLPQSPITYNPYTNTGEKKEDISDGIERKNHVLFSMYRAEMISKKEYEDALNYDIRQDFIDTEAADENQNGYLYYFVQDEAIKALMPKYYEKDGLSRADIQKSHQMFDKYYTIAERELRQNGYDVQTTIDQGIYDALQQAVVDYQYLINDGRGLLIQTGSVLLDNQSGKILGFIGGTNYSENQNNHAFQTRRSPGSTMKPPLVYAPAIDIGLIGSESQLSNFPSKYKNGQPYTNYGGATGNKFESVRYALKNSLNIPVIHLYDSLLQETNPEEYFKKMNIKMDAKEFQYESIPLGATDHGLTVEEQTASYATLANRGIYNEPYAIEKITDHAGNIIYEHQNAPVEVFSPATASIMNDLMRDVLNSGTATQAKSTLQLIGSGLANADFAGKTGTSEDDKDFWFIASNPRITFSSWIGYDDNTVMYQTWGSNNMQFWAYALNRAYQANPDLFGIEQRFELDNSVIKSEVSDFTGEKFGNVTINGKTIKVPGKKITSYYAQSGAPASQFKFGIGGTDEQYNLVWKPYLSAPAPSSSAEKPKESTRPTPTAPSSSSSNENSNSPTTPSSSSKEEKDEPE